VSEYSAGDNVSGMLTSDILRLEQRDGKRDGAQDKDGGNDTFHDVSKFQFAKLNEIFANPSVLETDDRVKTFGVSGTDTRDLRSRATYLYDGEYGTKAYADHEYQEKHPMEARVAFGVKYGEQDEPCSSNERADNSQTREYALATAHIRDEAAQRLR
jgi:hypothetical protein